MTPRKQSKRMWGVFNDGDCIASFERREVARNWKTSREIVRPVTRAALRTAIGWFREYEALHRAKGTADGHQKADVNASRANELATALPAAPPSEGGRT